MPSLSSSHSELSQDSNQSLILFRLGVWCADNDWSESVWWSKQSNHAPCLNWNEQRNQTGAIKLFRRLYYLTRYEAFSCCQVQHRVVAHRPVWELSPDALQASKLLEFLRDTNARHVVKSFLRWIHVEHSDHSYRMNLPNVGTMRDCIFEVILDWPDG